MTREQFIQEIKSLKTSLEQIHLIATYSSESTFGQDMAGYLEEFSDDLKKILHELKVDIKNSEL